MPFQVTGGAPTGMTPPPRSPAGPEAPVAPPMAPPPTSGMAPPELSVEGPQATLLPSAEPPTQALTLYWVTSRDRVADAKERVLARARETDPTADWHPAVDKRLRFAVAMRGGVSLAVWIGGAVAELDLLRGIEVRRLGDTAVAFVAWPQPAPPAAPVRDRVRLYAQLLHDGGYSGVDCDVLAGASAGGLNSVMWATAQRAGAPVDSMLDTWRDVGGLDALMHPPGFRGVDALLQGDGYFWPQVRFALERFHWSADAHPDRVAPHVSVDLSATLIDSADASDPDIREGRGDFHFSGRASVEDPLWPERAGALPNDIPRRELAPTIPETEMPPDAPGSMTSPRRQAPRGSAMDETAALDAIRAVMGQRRDGGGLDPDARARVGDALAALPPGRVESETDEREVQEASSLVLPADVAASLDRLAYAARTTSSFPGAFEPARIDATAGGTSLRTAERPNMRFAFGAHRAPEQPPYLVIDGGVFDNIPITRALTVVRMRTANVHAERRLVYLDPSPPVDPLVRVPYDPSGSRFTRAVVAAVGRRLRKETEAGEVADIDAFARGVQLGYGRGESFAALARVKWTTTERERRERAYVRYRQSSDANLLVEVLTTPSRSQLTWRVPLRRGWIGIDRPTVDAVRQAVYFRAHNAAWGDDDVLHALTRDPQGLVDAAQCVLSCVRWIEQIRIWSQAPELDSIVAQLPDIREGAYRAMNTAVALRDAALARVLEAADRTRRTEGRADAPDEPSQIASAVKESWFAEPPAPEAAALARAWDVLGAQTRALVAPLGALQALAATISDDDHAAALARWSDPPPPEPGEGWRRGTARIVWDEGPWVAILDAHAKLGDDLGAGILPPLFAATGMPPVLDDLPYTRIDGHTDAAELAPDDEGRPSVLGPTVARLLEKDRRLRVQAALDAAGKGAENVADALVRDRGRLLAGVKLAGTRIANFSGFLSADWRENDWWWGRLDMAAGIVGMLPPQDTTGAGPAAAARAATEQLRAGILGEIEGVGTATGSGAPLERGVDGIGALDPSYVTSLASRGARVLMRALPRPGVRADSLAVTALLWLLRPVLVVLPTVVDAPRLIAIALVLLAGGVATSWPAYEVDPVPFRDWLLDPWFFVPALVAIGGLMFAFAEASSRWRAVSDAAPDDRDIPAWRAKAAARGWTFALLVVVAFAPLALAVRVGDVAMTIVWIVVVFALVVLVDRRARQVPPEKARTSTSGLWRTAAIVLLAVVLAAAFAATLGLRALRFDASAWWFAPALWAVVLTIVGLLVLAGWQHPLAVVVIAVAATVVAAGGAAFAWALSGSAGLAWVVAIVVWGNVLWLAPELGWRRLSLSDRPRPARA